MSAEKRRAIYRVQVALDAISDILYSQRSFQIAQKLIRLPEFTRADVVGIFVGYGGEIDTMRLIEATLKLGKRVAAPTTNTSQRRLIWREVTDPAAQIDLGPLGTPEPLPKCHEVPADDFGLIAVPGTVWDEKGLRLTLWPGYFERFLQLVPRNTFKVGLAFDLQVVEDLSKWVDNRIVDALITEDRFFRFGHDSQPQESRRLPGGPMGYKG